MFYPQPTNDPVLQYQPGSPERQELSQALASLSANKIRIPCIIGGKEVWTSEVRQVVEPHRHGHVLAEYCYAGPKEFAQAVEASQKAKAEWEQLDWKARAAIFLKAADLFAGPYRARINAATMLGQSKNAMQAEVDSACEWVDFLRFNVHFYEQILSQQPASSKGVWNQLEWRALEGFVLAITPFNFTAIAGNLAATPAMLGNCVLWKPSDTQVFSAYHTMQILMEAGLPPGVINFLPADGPTFGEHLLKHPQLGGVHFTGSTATFQSLWKTIGNNIQNYRSYPRLVGETGGKGFVFAHPSADPQAVVAALIRGAFEYQGQKCSAASRAYLPKSLWSRIQTELLDELATVKMGDVRDFGNLVNSVIDARAFKKISLAIEQGSHTADAKLLYGGKSDASTGYFVSPTVIQAYDPKYSTMKEEIFGPVLTVYIYDDSAVVETAKICDETSPYSLTGAIFAQDRLALVELSKLFQNSAGNFYLNDKPTGAVVGQQPFGGARASGTNDKAGSALNLYRWLSPRTLKETFVPPKNYRYPFLTA